MPRHGENIYKRRDGRYEGRYVIGKTSIGKTRFGYIYGYQYAAVRNQLLQKKAEQLKKQNDNITDCTLLLKDLLQHWLENEVIGRVQQSSYQTYVRQINAHLLPKLGSLTLSEISSSVIYQFVAQLEASSMAYNSIKSVVRLLNAPLRYAQEMGYISQNPCRKIKIQPKEIIEQRVLSRLEQDKLRKDRKYRENPYRAENFHIDPDGVMHCPNGKAFHFRYRKNVKGNKYGRQEEVFECEDCSGCAYASECKKTPKNRTVRINQELTAMHREVLDNLNSIHGALLRMNRSIQAEGTFGVMKYDRRYRRIVGRGLKSVRLEVFLVFIGHNLYKLCNKTMKKQNVA